MDNYLKVQVLPEDRAKVENALKTYSYYTSNNTVSLLSYVVKSTNGFGKLLTQLLKHHVPYEARHYQNNYLYSIASHMFSDSGEQILHLNAVGIVSMTSVDGCTTVDEPAANWRNQGDARKLWLTKQLLKGDINGD